MRGPLLLRELTEEEARVIQVARTCPNELGLPYASWTVEPKKGGHRNPEKGATGAQRRARY